MDGNEFIWKTPEGHRYIILYFIIINLLGVLVMALDKYKAQKGKWRISEKTLFLVTILGGGIGTIFGMYKFRHKTHKIAFIIGFPTILIMEIIILIFMISKGIF
ncbi:MAG: DUF1294 domain-containing protein [Clostridia bacterium]|nr:DUF1294 domain-containing protein [Clostridia bacterium]